LWQQSTGHSDVGAPAQFQVGANISYGAAQFNRSVFADQQCDCWVQQQYVEIAYRRQ
jgi:hypothetical protein